MNIHHFKPGQHITRTEPVYVTQPAEMNHTLGIKIDQDPLAKFDFVGSECVLLGIINRGITIKVVDGYQYHLPLHKEYPCDWSEGWALFEEPIAVEPEEEELPAVYLPDPRFLSLAGWLFLILCCCIWAYYDPDKLTALETAFLMGIGAAWSLVCYFNVVLSSWFTRRHKK